MSYQETTGTTFRSRLCEPGEMVDTGLARGWKCFQSAMLVHLACWELYSFCTGLPESHVGPPGVLGGVAALPRLLPRFGAAARPLGTCSSRDWAPAPTSCCQLGRMCSETRLTHSSPVDVVDGIWLWLPQLSLICLVIM